MSLGALGYVGYGKEATEGVAVAPTKFLPISSFSFEDSDDYMLPEQIRQSRDFSIAMPAPFNVSGSMEMELIPLDIAMLLRSAWAATVASGSYAGGGYEHTFTPGSEEPTFTFESSAAGILVMRYSGIRVNTLEIKAAYGEIVTANFGLEGTARAKQGAESSPVTYADCTPFHFSGASVKTSGTANPTVKEFTFSVNNNIERIGTLRKTRAWKRMALGMREVTLSLALDFTDTVEYDAFAAGNTFDVELHLEGEVFAGSNKHTLSISIPEVRWTKVGVPLAAGDYLEQTVEATITRPNGGDIFTAVLVNEESTVA